MKFKVLSGFKNLFVFLTKTSYILFGFKCQIQPQIFICFSSQTARGGCNADLYTNDKTIF